jgi:L-fuconolactonase
MDHNGVDRAVLIQYAGNSDNSYLIECLERHNPRLAAAMIVDPADDGSAVRRWADAGIGGIRLPVDARSTSPDPLAIWRAADTCGLVVSAPCTPDRLVDGAFAELVEQFPNLAIVIEHLGGVGATATPPYEVFSKALELARYPNLTMKLPGFGEICRVPMPFDPIPPLPRMALEAFGAGRLMWGSDYPPASSREGYTNALQVPQEYFADLSTAEQAAIFGETAARIWF